MNSLHDLIFTFKLFVTNANLFNFAKKKIANFACFYSRNLKVFISFRRADRSQRIHFWNFFVSALGFHNRWLFTTNVLKFFHISNKNEPRRINLKKICFFKFKVTLIPNYKYLIPFWTPRWVACEIPSDTQYQPTCHVRKFRYPFKMEIHWL